MGLRWKAVKGRAHPLTRLSLGAPVPSCWTELSERTEEPEREEESERKRKSDRKKGGDGRQESTSHWDWWERDASRRETRRGMKTREDEGIEDRWKRGAELSAESPGRKTRHHRKIALSRTHLFSIPSSWPFAPACARARALLGRVPTCRFSPLRSPADSSVRQRIYKSVSSVSFVPLGSPDSTLFFSLFCFSSIFFSLFTKPTTHVRSIFRKTRRSFA